MNALKQFETFLCDFLHHVKDRVANVTNISTNKTSV